MRYGTLLVALGASQGDEANDGDEEHGKAGHDVPGGRGSELRTEKLRGAQDKVAG